MKITPARLVLLLLLLLTGLRLAYIGQIELSADEAYYQMWSQRLDWGYYSKGPGVALAIRAGTALFGVNAFGVRFFSPWLALATSLMLFALARRLYGLSVGVWLVVLLGVLPISQAGALLMTIDPLSIAFWSAGLLTCWLALERRPGAVWYWLLTGLCIGLGFVCKYTNAMQLLGVILALGLVPRWRREFRRPGFYLMLAAAIASGCPPVLWNASHAWVTIGHLRSRGHLDSALVRPWREFGHFVSAQAAVYSPLVFIGILAGIWWGWRQARAQPAAAAANPADVSAPRIDGLSAEAEKARFLLAFGLPLLAMYALLAFKTAGEPNWTAPAFISLSVLAAALWHERARHSRTARAFCICAVIVALPASVLMLDTDLVRQAGFAWPYDRDPTSRLLGWGDTARTVAAFRRDEERALGAPVFLIANRYQLAAELNFYLPGGAAERGGEPPVFMPQSQDLETQFSFWPSYDDTIAASHPRNSAPSKNAEEEFEGIRESPYIGQSALFVTDEEKQRRLPDAIETGFEQTGLVAEYVVKREGLPLRHLWVYACFRYKGLDL
jgi:4-amino-4-deoxy-L-arabinose transferase-like glycosyltransferase